MPRLTQREIQKNIKELEHFASRYGWDVVYSNKKEDYFQNNTIFLNKGRTSEILYYIFLHEIGHAWLQQSDYSYEFRYAELAKRKRYSTLTYRISRLQDELEAWEIATKIANGMGLRVNPAKFEKIRARCLKTYMIWAVKPRKRLKKP